MLGSSIAIIDDISVNVWSQLLFKIRHNHRDTLGTGYDVHWRSFLRGGLRHSPVSFAPV